MHHKKSFRPSNSYNYSSKIVLVGDSAVGKTNLLLRLVNQQYKMAHTATIGVDLKIKTISHHNKKIRMQIWDTAGQERFRTITDSYFKDTAGIILVYSVTDRKSFQNLAYWFQKIKETGVGEGIVLMLAGNKCDDENGREVKEEEGKELAKRFGYEFRQVSGKENINVQQIFQLMGQKVIEQIEATGQTDNNNLMNNSSIMIKSNQEKTKQKCCW